MSVRSGAAASGPGRDARYEGDRSVGIPGWCRALPDEVVQVAFRDVVGPSGRLPASCVPRPAAARKTLRPL